MPVLYDVDVIAFMMSLDVFAKVMMDDNDDFVFLTIDLRSC